MKKNLESNIILDSLELSSPRGEDSPASLACLVLVMARTAIVSGKVWGIKDKNYR